MIRLFKHYIPHAVLLVGVIDLILLYMAGDLSWRLRAAQIGMDPGSSADRFWQLGGHAAVMLGAMVAVGVYGAEALRSMRYATARLLVAISFGIIGLAFLDFIVGGGNFWRSTLAYAMIGSVFALVLNRLLVVAIVGTEHKDLLRIKTTGVHVNDFSSFIERETGRVDLETVNPSWLIFNDGFSSGQVVSRALKRLFDIVVSGLVLLLTAPVILLFALLVRLDSKGPAFYRQTRVGLYGQPFDVIKLRSMRTDAEVNGVQWASENDPRVTRIGNFIRKTRIDELPQLWTVLKGEMSFVGPRPERPEFVADLEQHLPYYAERHMVKPGITGWAQINYPYGASIEDSRHKLEYDLYYAKNCSPFLDLLILLQTLRVVLWNEGAR